MRGQFSEPGNQDLVIFLFLARSSNRKLKMMFIPRFEHQLQHTKSKKDLSLNHIFIYILHRKSCERFPTFPIFIERSLWMLKNCSLSFWRSGHASSSIWLNVLKVKTGLPSKEEYSTLYGGFRKSGSQSSGTAKNKIDDSLFHLFIQFGHDLSKNCSRGCDMRSM